MINLFKAIIQKNIKKVEYHLDYRPDPNSIIDVSGLSVMHFSCQSTDGIFKHLLECGGSTFNRDSDAVSIIDYASFNPEIHRLIGKKSVINDSMH